MELAVNELSYDTASSEGEAKTWYDTFFNTCLQIQKELKCEIFLKYSISPKESNLHLEYPFMRWFDGQSQDSKSYILNMLVQTPLIQDYPYYKVYGVEGKGIGYAYETGDLLISIKSHKKWEVTFLRITQEALDEGADELLTNTKDLNHCFDYDSSAVHRDYIALRVSDIGKNRLKEITNGKILWEQRARFFPNLIFCDAVESEIRRLAGDTLVNLRERLHAFQCYFSKWENGDFDYHAIGGDLRLESDGRIKKHNKELTIRCPDGNDRLFSFHCNYGIWGKRMHFFPDHNTRKCIIGYIGEKIVN